MSRRGSRRPLLIAHRTCPKHAPENSIAGIRFADGLGADMVEIDVRGTRDLERVLMHDRFTRRTAGGLWIVSRTSLSRIRALRLKSADEHGVACRPPLLREALAAVGTRMGVAVEVKDPRVVSGILADIREARMADRTLLWSYSRAGSEVVRAPRARHRGLSVARHQDHQAASQAPERCCRARRSRAVRSAGTRSTAPSPPRPGPVASRSIRCVTRSDPIRKARPILIPHVFWRASSLTGPPRPGRPSQPFSARRADVAFHCWLAE